MSHSFLDIQRLTFPLGIPEFPDTKESLLFEKLRNDRAGTKMIIDGYNHWLDTVLIEQISGKKFAVRDPQGKPVKYAVYTNVTYKKPMKTGDKEKGNEIPLYPLVAEHCRLSYKVSMTATETIFDMDHKQIGNSTVVKIGEMPLMLGSKYCWLSGLNDCEKAKHLQDPLDPLGYFIVKGTKRVLITQENVRQNIPLVMEIQGNTEVRVTYQLKNSQGTCMNRVVTGKKFGAVKVGLASLKNTKRHHCPILLLNRIFLIRDPKFFIQNTELSLDARTDDDIMAEQVTMDLNFVEKILHFVPQKKREIYRAALDTSMIKSSAKTKLDVITSYIIKKMPRIRSETHADRYVEIRKQMLRDFYSQIPDTEEGIEIKTWHLAFLGSIILRYKLGDRKHDDRDSWSCKYLKTAGINFQTFMTGILYEAEEQTDRQSSTVKTSNHTNQITPASKIKQFITNYTEDGFQTHGWGIKTKGDDKKENISDFLKEDTPGALISQMNRISVPTNRQTKNGNIRQLTATQKGQVCIIQTPEGQGVGLVKYKAILMRQSLEVSSKTFMQLMETVSAPGGYLEGEISKTYQEAEDGVFMPINVNGVFYWWFKIPFESEHHDILGRPISETERFLLAARKSGILPRDACIFFNRTDRVLEYMTTPGRTTTPLAVINNGEILADKYNTWGRSIEELIQLGHLEYMDAREMEYLKFALSPKSAREYKARFDLIKNIHSRIYEKGENVPYTQLCGSVLEEFPSELFKHIQPDKFEKAYRFYLKKRAEMLIHIYFGDTAEYNNERLNFDFLSSYPLDEKQSQFYSHQPVTLDMFNIIYEAYNLFATDIESESMRYASEQMFSHCFIDGVQSFGVNAANEFLPNHGQGPRAAYQASMLDQAFNIQNVYRMYRFLSSSKVMLSPSVPIVSTIAARVTGREAAPAGVLVTNQKLCLRNNNEDAIVMKREFLDSEELKYVKYSSTRLVIDSANGGILTRPDKAEGNPIYHAIGPDGLPKLDAYLNRGDCIIGRKKVIFKDGEYKPNDTSLYVGVGEEGYVDAVWMKSNVASSIVYVRLRQIRRLKPGDKLAACYAQKGTISDILNAADMPICIDGPNAGSTADIVTNSHSIPSRMTVNQLIEGMVSKASVYTDERVDMTAFHKVDFQKYINILNKSGFCTKLESVEEDGKEIKQWIQKETVMWPNGKVITDVSTTLEFYQLLKHNTDDKFQVRREGACKNSTHQPTNGRQKAGGLRFGEMERDILISYGASGTAKERLMGVSDKHFMLNCENCGSMPIMNPRKDQKIECKICDNKDKFAVLVTPYVNKHVQQLLAGTSIGTENFGKRTVGPPGEFDSIIQ